MQNLPPEILNQIRDAIRRPEGTVEFEYFSPDLLSPHVPGGIVFQITAGGHIFRLERTRDFYLKYYYASPGTGTRVAAIDLKEAPRCSQAFIAFTWSPSEIHLYCGPRAPGAQLLSSSGTASQRQFRVGKDGAVYEIGDEGVEVIGVSIYQKGKPVLHPTAIEAWSNTKQAILVLGSGVSDQGYIYEVVVTNLTISMLITGFEAYSKTRFTELEDEGIVPDVTALIETFFPKREREAGIASLLQTEAAEASISVLKYLIQRGAINFQNYTVCKRAYNKGYRIRFGEMNLDSDTLEWLQRFIQYRHLIIHVSPMIGMLNQSRVPPEDPVFPDRDLAEKAVGYFDRFIHGLHEATLRLKRQD